MILAFKWQALTCNWALLIQNQCGNAIQFLDIFWNSFSHHLEISDCLQRLLMSVNECIKLQTMHFQRVMFILCRTQVNSFHRDLSQPQIIQDKLEHMLLWEGGTPIYILLPDIFKDSALKFQALNKFSH